MRLQILLFSFFLLVGCAPQNRVTTLNGATMGTIWTVKIIGKNHNLQSKIEDRLRQLNQIFSTYDEHSELSQLNKKPDGVWHKISPELFFVLENARDIYQQTNGYFDPTIGNLIDLWGFGASFKNAKKPSNYELKTALSSSIFSKVRLQNGRLKKSAAVRLNLSAIAKGYAVDELSQLLKDEGILHFLVEIGGEIYATNKPNGSGWKIGIEMPDGTNPEVLILKNRAVASSGNYRNFLVFDGEAKGHIINPKSGKPSKTDLAGVSVLHQKTMIADAFATAFMAMGSAKSEVLARKLGLEVWLILDKNIIKVENKI